MNDFSPDVDRPITDEERDAILSEIAAHPLGQAVQIKLIPAYCDYGKRIIMIIQRDPWRIMVGAHERPWFRFQRQLPEFTTWHAIKRDLSNLCDVLDDVRQQLYEEGR